MSALLPEALATARRAVQNLTAEAGHALENFTMGDHGAHDSGALWKGVQWMREHNTLAECSAHKDCNGCLEATDEGDAQSCFWCFATQTCQSVSVSDLVQLDPFGGCKDYLLDADQCKCRPSTYTSCGECAQLAHPTCLWMDEATLTTTVRYQPPGAAVATEQVAASVRLDGRCVEGSAFGPSRMSKNVTLFESDWLGSLTAAYKVEVEPDHWFLGQCTVPAQTLAVVLIVGLLVLVGGAVAAACYFCTGRRVLK
jgi:hypothetical protein